MNVKKIGLLIILVIFPLRAASGQQYVPPEEEAPASLFSAEIGDADVELFLLGSWNLSLTGSLGISYNTALQQLTTASFPDMVPGVQFKQVPDLTISLWLMDRYFFESSILEDSDFNTFLLGYRGREDEFLRSVRIGNTEIAMDSYGCLSISDPPQNSLGAYTLMESEKRSTRSCSDTTRRNTASRAFSAKKRLLYPKLRFMITETASILFYPTAASTTYGSTSRTRTEPFWTAAEGPTGLPKQERP